MENNNKIQRRKWSSLLFLTITLFLINTLQGNCQKITPKKYPIIKDYYGIRIDFFKKSYGQEKYGSGTVGEDFMKFTGKEYEPDVYFDGYKLFNETHYVALLNKLCPTIKKEKIIELCKDKEMIGRLARDIIIIVNNGIQPGESRIQCSFRLNPDKKFPEAWLIIYPINENGSIKLRGYINNRGLGDYLMFDRPLKTSQLKGDELIKYNILVEKGFWKNFDIMTSGIFEIGPDDMEAYPATWEKL